MYCVVCLLHLCYLILEIDFVAQQIDLERTEALRRTAEENHRTAEREREREGERHTRHNSTLGEFLKDAVKRNSAS